ncbi:MAG: serine--tRNA ligase [Oscillospiraceae bacterium]|nr:serine--tRNA ligase [Oscillospiraceae bacterium]
MLDIKRIRDNAEEVKAKVARRGKNYDKEIDMILEIDAKRREISSKTDAMKAEQNKVSKEMPMKKKNGEDVTALMAEMKELSAEIKQAGLEVAELEEQQRNLLLSVPNTPHDSVPDGVDDTANVEQRRWSEPTQFNFTPKAHWDIGKNLDILDPERAVKVTGARFHFYKGMGARLERAIINFYMDIHSNEHGYTEMLPPYMANRASMTGTGQLPKFAEDMYGLTYEKNEYFLIPTAEVPVTNYYRDEILDAAVLPQKFCAYSACFRGEAGSAGRDSRGLIRQHQFNKVELVKFVDPETSYDELESLTRDAEHCLQLLGLPYRVVALSAGDMGFSSAKTYDIEVWMPSYDSYKEISSCSNFEDYQARRMGVRFKRTAGDKAQLVHTLNGSGLAIGRTTAAILENYQNEDGSVRVPDVLVPYMGGVTVIK